VRLFPEVLNHPELLLSAALTAGFAVGPGQHALLSLLNLDAAFEVGAIFDADAVRGDIAGEPAIAADIEPVSRDQISGHFAHNNDFARAQVGNHHPVLAHGHAVGAAGKIDRSFHPALDVKRLRADDLTLNHQRLTN